MDIVSVLSHEEFMPHGVCLLWQPGLLWSSVVSDILIAISYFSIPLALMWFVRKRTDFEHRWILALFAAFIVLCGTTHLLGAIIIWKPFYYLDVAVKAATAVISVFTGVIMWPLVPKLLAMPSQRQLERANAALKESEERYREMFQASNAVKLVLDAETGRILDANSAACNFYGYGREVLLSMSIQQINILTPDEVKKELETAKTEKRDHVFYRHRLATGEVKDVEVFLGVVAFSGKKVIHAIIHDITERKTAEENLRRSEERFQTLSDAVFEGVAIHRDGIILECNKAYAQIFGYSQSEAIGLPVIDTVAPEFREEIKKRMAAGYDEPFEALAIRKDGARINVLAFGSWIDYQGQRTRCTVIQDITEKKAAAEALRHDDEILRALFNAITESVFIMDRNGVVLVMNDTAARRIGKRPEEVVGRNVIAMIPEDVARRRMKVIEKVFETGEAAYLQDRRGDFWLEQTLYPVKDAAGHVTSLAVFAIDVTARKKVEGQLHEAMRELCDANEELREFVYIASHDLQEPLRKVTGFGDRLKRHLGPTLDEKGADYLARMTGAAERMSQLIEDLLAFSRVTTRAKPFEPVDLGEALRTALEDLEFAIKEAGAVITADSLPVLDADRMQMRQLFQNLIGNSIKYRRPAEPCRIAVLAAPSDAVRELNGKQYAAGELLLVSVEDNGIGFDEKYVDRIFGVFQRLHGRGEYKGTGVGLAICKKIVERHNGKIEVVSKPGEGSRFTVILPLRQTTPEGM